MSQRLTELQRQRALLQEHLAWLDREIAAEQGAAPSAPKSTPAPSPLPEAGASLQGVRSATPIANPTSTPTPPPLPEVPSDVETIIAQYRQDPNTLTTDTRRGCLMIFGYVVLGSVLLVALVYWLYARHLGRWW